MKNVIVTGAAGFLGSTLIKKLLENGANVAAIDVGFDNGTLPDQENLTKIAMQLTDAEGLAGAIPEGEYDAFYHFAWRGVNGPEKADPDIQSENIRLTLACAKAAKMLNCPRLLIAGTVAERAVESLLKLEKTTGGMMYAAAKNAAHQMTETYCKYIGQPFIWMQFANIYGPGNHTGNLVSYTLDQLGKNEEAQYGPAEQPYDFIFVEDLIEAVYRLGDAAWDRTGYYIGSGDPRQLKDYLRTIGALRRKENLIGIGKRPDDGVTYQVEMFDITPLVKTIGPYVKTSFEEGVVRTIRENKANG